MRTNLALTAAAVVGACAAIAAPAGFAAAETAQETISRLQSQGYTVTIDKVGTASMDECTVTSVRNPQTVTQLVPYIGPGRGNNRTALIPAVVSQTVSVSLNCSR
jgi:poly(3-hydroxybutyrate) depolymerase